MKPTMRQRSAAFLCAVLGVGALVAAAVPGAPSVGALDPPGPYTVAVPAGGFETPTVAAATDLYRPAGTPWTYSDQSGVSTAGSTLTAGVPAFPGGTRVGFIRNSSKIVQQIWLEPGDQLRFSATQTQGVRNGLETLAVAIDGVVQGSPVTPGDGVWTQHVIALSLGSPRRVFLEIRGPAIGPPADRTALIDDVTILRAPSAIGDSGLGARTQRGLLSPRPIELQGGVVGTLHVGDSEPLVNTPVQAIAQSGNRIFIGGKFANVQPGEGAALQSQSYIAAFDRTTGAWVSTFRPDLDGTVWDMVVVDGKLILAGQFTNVNGVANTAGLAALDPTTGQVVPGWRSNLQLVGGTFRPFARSLDVYGMWLIVGGRFNRVAGPSGTPFTATNLARVAIADGAPGMAFHPAINGQVYDVDAQAGRVYAVGKFSSVNGQPSRAIAIVDTVDGTTVPGMGPLQFSSDITSLQYQQAVRVEGAGVWIGGSQHHTQLYSTTDLTRLRSYVSAPQGDIQAMVSINGYLYTGSHANQGTFHYANATENLTLTGWTTRDPVRWIATIDMATRNYLPAWLPQVGTHNGEGAWELFVDSQSCMWAGGDFKRGAFIQGVAEYAQGFVKFCPVDSVAPSVPPTPVAKLSPGGVTLTWGASVDDRVGGLRYDIFRNDRMIAEGVASRLFTDPSGVTGGRYFIRSSDLASNRSATTGVLVVGPDTENPKTPQNLQASIVGADVSLTWTAPTDNVGVVEYAVFRNGVERMRVTSTSALVTGLGSGQHFLQVQAFDAAGNRSNKTPSAVVTLP